MCRLVLKNAREIAALQASVHYSWMISCTQVPALEEMDEYARNFITRARNISGWEEKAALGILHMRLLDKLLTEILGYLDEELEKDQCHSEEKEALTAQKDAPQLWLNHLKTVGPETISHLEVPLVKVIKAHDSKKKKKLLLSLNDNTESHKLYVHTILPYLRSKKGRMLTGHAPRGDLERQLQGWLDRDRE